VSPLTRSTVRKTQPWSCRRPPPPRLRPPPASGGRRWSRAPKFSTSSCGRWAYRRTRRSSTTCTVSTLTRWIWCPSPCSPLFSASLIHPRYVGHFSSPNQESRHIGHARETYFPPDFGEIRAPIRLFTQTSASMSSFRITHQASPLPVPKPVLSVIPFFFWKGGGVLIAGVQAMMRH